MKVINQNHHISTKTVRKKSYREQIVSTNLFGTTQMASVNGKWFCILICMLQSCQRWEG